MTTPEPLPNLKTEHVHDDTIEFILPPWVMWGVAGAAIGVVVGLGLKIWVEAKRFDEIDATAKKVADSIAFVIVDTLTPDKSSDEAEPVL